MLYKYISIYNKLVDKARRRSVCLIKSLLRSSPTPIRLYIVLFKITPSLEIQHYI